MLSTGGVAERGPLCFPMAQPFKNEFSVERVSTNLDAVYPSPELEVGAVELPPDVSPEEHNAHPVTEDTGGSNAAQQGRPTIYI